MKILQLCNKMPYPPKDGGAKAIYTMAMGLKDAGIDVQILAMNTSKHLVDASEYMQSNIPIEAVSINSDIGLLGLISNLLFSDKPYTATRFLKEDFSRALMDKLNQQTFDIIQLEGLYLLPFVPMIRRHSKAKLVYRAHNVESKIWGRAVLDEKNLLKKLYLKHLSKRLKRFEQDQLNQYDALVPITQKDHKELQVIGNNKPSMVIPFGLNLSGISESIHEDFQGMFYLGALDWLPNEHGIKWFVEQVWTKLKVDIPFTVAGRNCSAEFKAYLLNHGVEFLGELDEVDQYIKSHSVLVMPLFSGSGMRVKIVEAMAYGKTVLTTKIGVEGINAENGKDLFILETPEDYISVIENLFANPKEIREIGQNARTFAYANFELKNLTQSLIEFYERISS